MRQNFSIFDYLTNSSEYIKNLQALAQEREWINPTTDLFGSKNWNDYIDRVVEEGLKVGKAGYIYTDLFPVSVDGIPLVAAPHLRFLLYPLDGYLGT